MELAVVKKIGSISKEVVQDALIPCCDEFIKITGKKNC